LSILYNLIATAVISSFDILTKTSFPENARQTAYNVHSFHLQHWASWAGMTEVTTDTTDHNARLVPVGGIGNYAAMQSVVSEFFTA